MLAFSYVVVRFALLGGLVAAVAAGDPVKNYGQGTPGSGGRAPTLWATTTPRPGDANFGLLVESGLGGSVGAMFLSPLRGGVNIGGLQVLLDLTSSVTLATFPLQGSGAGNGTALLPLPLPNVASLLNAEFHLQAFVADPAGAFVGVSATPGLTLAPQRPGLVLVTRSVGGSPDQQMAIDLASATVTDFSHGQIDNGHGVAFSAGCTHAFVGGGLSRNVALYDVRTFPGTHVGTYLPLTAGVSPWSVTMNPDGRRAYIVTQGSASTTPMVEVMDGDPSSATFGQPFPGGGFLAGSISALDLHFTPDGDTGFLSSLGIGGPAGVTRFDTRIGSATYHQNTGAFALPGQFVFASGIATDGTVVYAAAANLGATAEVAQIHAASLAAIDWDAGAPGVQNIGGEQSRAPTPIGRTVGGLAADPRGRWLYIASSGSVVNSAMLVRVDVDPASANYTRFQVYATGLSASATLGAVVVSAAGDRVYLASTSDNAVHEIDAAAFTQVRTFAVNAASGLALR